jgi:DNA-directed RNA polymerase subunit RPC12/RpoP
MTRKRYRCPSCEGIFVYDHHPSVEADPVGFCPRCGFTQDMDPALVAPHIGRTIAKTVDNMHRDIEDGEKFRADMARERFGLDADEARAMVATNSLDNMRAGEITAMPVNNAVSQAIAANPNAYGWSGGAAQGMALSPSVQSGPFPNAGLRALQKVRAAHPGFVAASGHKTTATSSLPALETQQPGYRQRI